MHFANPFANAMFWPLLFTLCGVLSAAFGYGLFVERKRIGQFHRSAMFAKLLSSSVLAPLAMLSILSGPGGLFLLVSVLSIIGVLEYASITSMQRVHLPVTLAVAVALPGATLLAPHLMLHVLAAAVLISGTVAVFTYRTPVAGSNAQAQTQILTQCALAVLCVLYAPLMGSFAIRISAMESGGGLILALLAAVALSDTMALVIGRAVGGPKLAPHVSPNKTIAGFVGNILGAYVGFLLMQFVCPSLPLSVLMVLPALIGVASVIGDLFESLIKRSFGVKDAASWLPGFGGLLDRVDSLLFVLPIAYLVLSLVL